MIGIKKKSTGQMGNRLLCYHLLRQLSQETGVNYFNIKLPDSRYFSEMDRKKRPFSFWPKQIRLTAKEINSTSPDELIRLIKEKDLSGYDIILEPPLLGDFFFDYLFADPREFIKIKSEYQIPLPFDVTNKVIIGLHFRGTDFKAWDEKASLKPLYYQKALTFCLNFFQAEQLVFVLFTDDQEFPSYLETIDYLRQKNINFHLSLNINRAIVDFYQLSQCDVLISSPSTFAILAGAIGKQKKIIHNQEWLDYCWQKNDKFWTDLKTTNNPYYSLWKSL